MYGGGYIQDTCTVRPRHAVPCMPPLSLRHFLSLSLLPSLSLSVSAKPRRATKEGQWDQRTPLHIITLAFSAQHGSKNPGFVLRPLSPDAIASMGVAYCRCVSAEMSNGNVGLSWTLDLSSKLFSEFKT